MEKWTSRKFWSHVAAGFVVLLLGVWLEVRFLELLEKKLITAEIYSSLASGIFWTVAVFIGAAVGIYAVANVSLDWIHKGGDR
ncbi:MAG: hypothetical protein AMS19_02595 [Gemmatimonas sp. SG8_23]|jgi:hypothetical protein|nr:MAG: hypothetical protein AMS19_02595 [Gemmatimonas sp. SG8_23]